MSECVCACVRACECVYEREKKEREREREKKKKKKKKKRERERESIRGLRFRPGGLAEAKSSGSYHGIATTGATSGISLCRLIVSPQDSAAPRQGWRAGLSASTGRSGRPY